MSQLTIRRPFQLSEHFDIALDDTKWSQSRQYHKISAGFTPDRPRAPFGWKNSLHPRTDLARSLERSYGLYMVGVRFPIKAFYVGIAAGSGKSPEGILSRIKKHRVKLTASHVGSVKAGEQEEVPRSVGGVSHTRMWREFAVRRYASLCDNGALPDHCSDVLIATAFSENSLKSELERFEADIFRNRNNMLSQLFDMFWPGEHNENVLLLTKNARKGCDNFNPIYVFAS